MTDSLRPHERWWEDHADTAGMFRQWLDESDPWSRREVVQIVEGLKARSVLEVGPGLFHDWQTYWKAHPWLSYQAVELTPKLVAYGHGAGATVHRGSIVDLPLADGAVDVAYTRHVLEHLAPHEIDRAVAELTRVSRKAAVIVLFHSGADIAEHQLVEDTTAAPGTYCHRLSRPHLARMAEAQGLRCAWSHGGRDWVLTLTW